jgi:hypothetical protein
MNDENDQQPTGTLEHAFAELPSMWERFDQYAAKAVEHAEKATASETDSELRAYHSTAAGMYQGLAIACIPPQPTPLIGEPLRLVSSGD